MDSPESFEKEMKKMELALATNDKVCVLCWPFILFK